MSINKAFRVSSSQMLILYLLFAIFLVSIYYPKWNKKHTEAAISWDIAGYYIYLPAIFIYKDLKKLAFKEGIYATYNPYATGYENYTHANGNEVIKYSSGMAVMYSPFFFVAHLIAKPLGYPRDGYSLPYQFAIVFGGLLMAFLGLFVLRKILLLYFDDGIVAWVILLIGIGTNFLEYATMHSPMTHGHVFLLVSALIWFTIRYYGDPTLWKAVGLGAIIGMASLIRPTESILLIIPLLWDVGSLKDLRDRITYLFGRLTHVLAAGLVMAAIGSIQILYWLYVADDPIVYSYQDQSFDFLKPHIGNGLFSYRKGWFMYTPIMILSVIGFYHLYKKRINLFVPIFLYVLFHVYITLSWSIWWYGGGLGQRALIHAYPALAFSLAAFLVWGIGSKKWYKYPLIIIILLGVYYNLWLTHQAHRGGLLETEAMTKKYFLEIFGRYEVPYDTRKFLDVNEKFTRKIRSKEVLYSENFEDYEKNNCQNMAPILGQNSLCVSPGISHTAKIIIVRDKISKSWIRISGDFFTNNKEWNVWNMSRFTAEFVNNNEVIKSKHIRVQRHIHGAADVHLYFETAVPDVYYDELQVFITNAESQKPLLVDNILIEQMD